MAKPFKVDTSAIGKFKNGKLYTLQEIADIAGTTHSTMYLATENGDLKKRKIKRTGKGSPFCSAALGEDVREWLLRKSGEHDVGAKTPERKIYEFMLSYQKRNGKPPIINEISTAVSMSPAYVKMALGILQDRGYVQEIVPGALFEAIPDDQRHRPNPLLGETDGARCRCGVALVWPQHVTPESVAALAERATVSDKRTWEEAIDRAQDLVRDMLTSDGVHCAMCARGV